MEKKQKPRCSGATGTLWTPPISQNPEPISTVLSRNNLTEIPTCDQKITRPMQDPSITMSIEQTKKHQITEVLNRSCGAASTTNKQISAVPSVSDRMIEHSIQSARNLCHPYQDIPNANQNYFLYEFRLPHPSMLAKLVGISEQCFGLPDQTIGLLFSKPLANDDNVCRIPLYLSHGMARAYIQRTNRLHLSVAEFKVVLCTHHVLCNLLCELITRDLYSVAEPDQTEAAPSLFSQLEYNPAKSLVAGLLCIVKWPSSTVDFEACECLLSGSFNPDIPIFSESVLTTTPNLTATRGIIPFRRTPLEKVNRSCWSGLLLRPVSVGACDLGMWACAGPVSDSCGSAECYRLSRNFQMGRTGQPKVNKQLNSSSYNPHVCRVYPLSAWLWFNLSLIPVVLYQINRALCCVEVANQLSKLVPTRIGVRYPVLIPDRLDAPKCMLSYLREPCELDHEAAACSLWPTDDKSLRELGRSVQEVEASNLLEALTTLGVSDAVNLERLELWGDSFLKLTATMLVYQQSSIETSEGELTNARIPYITNMQLEKNMRILRWSKYCAVRPYLAQSQFLPPGFILSDEADQAKHKERLFVEFNRKCLSDMFEALLGYLLTYANVESAFTLVQHFRPSVMESKAKSRVWLWRNTYNKDFQYLVESSFTLNMTTQALDQVTSADWSAVERRLGYRFRDSEHMLTALTHNSAIDVFDLPLNYERLEFLGDAVLDFLVTSYIYKRNPDFDPGQITACRSSITNNATLAYVMVKLELHPHVKHCHPHLPSIIADIQMLHSKEDRSCTHIDVIPPDLPNMKASKILSDVFEALIGAVFLDSGGDLSVTFGVILRTLHDRIDFVTNALTQGHEAT